jgi:putative FmdB family regulatory protein
MPIYEFFCADCNTIFNFFSSRPNTEKRPGCPKCGKHPLCKMMSTFATIGKAKEKDGDDPFAGMDESKMEQALEGLMREAEHLNEDDPRQMASLMRKFADKTGLNLGAPMEEAIARMEAGEDPQQIEHEMETLMDGEEPFSLEAIKKKALQSGSHRAPLHDERLYEL